MFKQQAKNLFLLAIIVFSTLAASLAFPNSASADTVPSVYFDPQVSNDAIASAYRVSLATCLTQDAGTHVGGGGRASAQDIASNKWFTYGDLRVGYLVNQSDGGGSCNTLFDGRDIGGTFGVTGNIQFACALGLTRGDKSDCVNGTGDFVDNINSNGGRDHVYSVLDAHRSNAAGQTGPVPRSVNFNPLHGFTNEQLYTLAADTYLVACKATPVTTTPTADQKTLLKDVNVVDYQGNATTVYFSQGDNGNKKFRNYEDNFEYMEENCDKMREFMKTYGPAFQTWVKNHQPGMNGTPGTCDEHFPPASDPTNNKACIDGYNNKGTANYCQNTYATTDQFLQDERTACIYGLTATGGAGTTGAPPPITPGPTASKPTCAITGVGWIICPIMNNFLAPAVDAAYGFISALLTVQPLMTTGGAGVTGTSADTYSTLYNAWSIMRNFANVAFVAAFLTIIFSQVTSIGISNYGIKRMLPRLIIAAVLVNLSFWLCAIAVDLSNIAGTSMNGIFSGITNALAGQTSGTPSVFSTGAGWVGLTATVLAGIGVGVFVLYIGLAALLPVLILILMTIITVVVALSVRQALIVLLVVLSPMAAIAYIFDESLAKKWLKLFRELLELFPIIAFVFGGSKLASQIVMNTAPANKDYAIVIQIVGAFIGVIPLILVPTIMKGVSGVVGKVMNNGGKGITAKLNKKADSFRDRQEGKRAINALGGGNRRYLAMGKYNRQAKRTARDASIQNEAKRAQAGYVAQQVIGNPKLANKLAGGSAIYGASSGATNRALSNAVKTEADIEADEIKAASLVISHLNLTQPELQKLSLGGQAGGLNGSNSAVQAAAMKSVIDAHNVTGVNSLLNAASRGELGGGDPDRDNAARKNLAEALQSSSQRPGYVGMSDIEAIRQHGKESFDQDGRPEYNADGSRKLVQAQSADDLVLSSVKKGAWSVEKLATGDNKELEYVGETIANNLGSIPAAALKQVSDNAKEALDPSSRFSGQVSKNRDSIDTISRL